MAILIRLWQAPVLYGLCSQATLCLHCDQGLKIPQGDPLKRRIVNTHESRQKRRAYSLDVGFL